MENSKYLELIIKYFSGSLNPEEEKDFHIWLESDPKNQKVFALFKQIWSTQEKDADDVDLKLAWNHLSRKAGLSLSFDDVQEALPHLGKRTVRVGADHGFRLLRYAAVFFIVFSLVYLFNAKKQTSPTEGQQEIYVQYGKQMVVNLSDGSKVILDAGSKLSFPKHFSVHKREVYLSGEAYFEVKHQQLRPFVIHANNGLITVLGTKFDVRAWQYDNKEVRVVVVDGSVSLRNESQNKSEGVVIPKGKMSYLAANHPIPSKPVPVKVEPYLAWMERDLILSNTPLYDVLDRLSRWYGLHFELPSPVYNKVKITGTFRKKSIDYILEVIGLTTHLNYKRNGNTVVFYKQK